MLTETRATQKKFTRKKRRFPFRLDVTQISPKPTAALAGQSHIALGRRRWAAHKSIDFVLHLVYFR